MKSKPEADFLGLTEYSKYLKKHPGRPDGRGSFLGQSDLTQRLRVHVNYHLALWSCSLRLCVLVQPSRLDRAKTFLVLIPQSEGRLQNCSTIQSNIPYTCQSSPGPCRGEKLKASRPSSCFFTTTSFLKAAGTSNNWKKRGERRMARRGSCTAQTFRPWCIHSSHSAEPPGADPAGPPNSGILAASACWC